MPDIGTMQDHIEDLMAENKQLRKQRDDFYFAFQYLAETIANVWSDKMPDEIMRDALETVSKHYG